ncbi:MAG: ATP-binding protein [Ferruginibacter sp.]
MVIGPESTGKSTLCVNLAAHYKTAWVKEYAREYLLTNGTDYTFENLLDVAKGQIALEEKATEDLTKKMSDPAHRLPTTQLMFIDTDMHVLQVWCEFVFNKCHNWILNRVVERKYDLYLLCNIDQLWVKDELREYPDLETREKLYKHYKEIMTNQQVPWVDITGNYDERLLKAIQAIDQLAYT